MVDLKGNGYVLTAFKKANLGGNPTPTPPPKKVAIARVSMLRNLLLGEGGQEGKLQLPPSSCVQSVDSSPPG